MQDCQITLNLKVFKLLLVGFFGLKNKTNFTSESCVGGKKIKWDFLQLHFLIVFLNEKRKRTFFLEFLNRSNLRQGANPIKILSSKRRNVSYMLL